MEVLELTLLVSDSPFAIKPRFASSSAFDDELEEESVRKDGFKLEGGE